MKLIINGKEKNINWARGLVLVLISLLVLNISLELYSLINKDKEQYNEEKEQKFFSGNVAVVPIKGLIAIEKAFPQENVAASDEIVLTLEKAAKDTSIKAIVLDINSNGAFSLAPSLEISDKIKKVNKTTVAWIREAALSGGYHVASAADWIIVNPASNVGSIGVIQEYEVIDVSHVTIKSGKYKDIFSPYRSLTDEEMGIAQEQIDSLHQLFISDIAKNRRMDRKKVEKIAEGLPYPGIEAKKIGLVDELGGKEEVLNYILRKEGVEPVFVYYNKKTGNFDLEYPMVEELEE